MKMVQKPTYAGKVEKKDEQDIYFWAFEKTAAERLKESLRLYCMNHNIDISQLKFDKTAIKASKRNG